MGSEMCIRDRFKVEMASDIGFTALFLPGEDCAKAYPYKYEFRVTYRFEELSVYCELTLKNLDSRNIPWAAGLHPYFFLPWAPGHTRKMYRLSCDAKKAVRFLPDGTFVPEDIFKNCFLFSILNLVRNFCSLLFAVGFLWLEYKFFRFPCLSSLLSD